MKVDAKTVFRVLSRISNQLSESVYETTLDKIVRNLKESKLSGNVQGYVAYLKILQEFVAQTANEETSKVLFEKLEEHGHIPHTISKYDLSTVEGFMKAFEDEYVKEMVSGAGIGGRMSGLGSNSQVNATGMAGTDPVLKKKKKNNRIVNVMNKRL